VTRSLDPKTVRHLVKITVSDLSKDRQKIADDEEAKDEKTTPKGKGVNPTFILFMKEEGDTLVPNPNPRSRDRFDRVKVKTLPNSEEGKRYMSNMYKAWLKTRYKKIEEKPKSKGKEESVQESKPKKTVSTPLLGVTKKDIEDFRSKHKKMFASMKDQMDRKLKETYGISDLNDAKLSEAMAKDLYSSNDYMSDVVRNINRYEADSLSAEEKNLRLTVQGLAYKQFEEVLSKAPEEVQTFYRDYIKAWVEDSSSIGAFRMQGVLASMGASGHSKFVLKEDQRAYEDGKAHGKGEMLDQTRSKNLREALKLMYTYNQALFQELGIKEVTLYRGVARQIDGKPPENGDKVQVQAREVSSWTTEPTIAAEFGRVLKAKVPVEHVLGGFLNDGLFGKDSRLGEKLSEYQEEEFMILNSSDIVCEVLDHAPVKTSSKEPGAVKKNEEDVYIVPLDDKNENWMRPKGNPKLKDKKKKKAHSLIAQRVAKRTLNSLR
jgi:hypothetical protein